MTPNASHAQSFKLHYLYFGKQSYTLLVIKRPSKENRLLKSEAIIEEWMHTYMVN